MDADPSHEGVWRSRRPLAHRASAEGPPPAEQQTLYSMCLAQAHGMAFAQAANESQGTPRGLFLPASAVACMLHMMLVKLPCQLLRDPFALLYAVPPAAQLSSSTSAWPRLHGSPMSQEVP